MKLQTLQNARMWNEHHWTWLCLRSNFADPLEARQLNCADRSPLAMNLKTMKVLDAIYGWSLRCPEDVHAFRWMSETTLTTLLVLLAAAKSRWVA